MEFCTVSSSAAGRRRGPLEGASGRESYPSDLPDEAGELIRQVITAWKARRTSVSGNAGQYAMREIVNAILYQARTGCEWRYLPPKPASPASTTCCADRPTSTDEARPEFDRARQAGW
jgi:transposase